MQSVDFNAGGGTDRATVVLLHSSAGSSRQWSALAEQLAPRYTVRTVDLHGHGARPVWGGPAPLALADEAALVAPILREAGRVHLVGHSYGAAVALKVATLHPHAVASVAAYEPVLFQWLFDDDPGSEAACEAKAIAATLHKYLDRGDAYRAAGTFLNYWSGAGTWESMSAARRDGAAVRMRSVLAHFGALTDATLTSFSLRRVHAPMLFLSGAATAATTARIAALLRVALPAAGHGTLPGMGHMGPLTHAPQVNREIVRFLDAQGAGRQSGEALTRVA